MEVNTAVTKLMRRRASVIHVCMACMFVLERVHVYSFAFRPLPSASDYTDFSLGLPPRPPPQKEVRKTGVLKELYVDLL